MPYRGENTKDWNYSLVVLLFKKGGKTKIIISRLKRKLEFNQSIKQATFRRNFSASDHILTLLRTLTEKYAEYNIPLYLAYVELEKAFGTI